MPDPIHGQAVASKSIEPGLFFGSANRAMRTLEGMVAEIAAANVSILISGESGTGKKAFARLLHEASPRRIHLPLRVVCGTLTPDSLVGQLRSLDSKGVFNRTVLFDEIGDLDRECQRRLLHWVANGDYGPSGETLPTFISTTSHNLEEEVLSGCFRNDLYHRLGGLSVRIPALRERPEDIPLLLEFFLTKHSARLARARPCVSQAGLSRLADHSWPGNLRELENVAMRILALGNEEVALASLFKLSIATRSPRPQQRGQALKVAAREASREAERQLILKALFRTRWNRKRAAQDLQISYKSLLYKLKQIGLRNPDDELCE